MRTFKKMSNPIRMQKSTALDKYLLDIKRFKLLSPEEEVALSLKIKNGDEKALESMVNSNLRFVVTIAKTYGNSSNILDLINEGNIALLEAAKTFDPTKGFKFSSYAVTPIRWAIFNYLNRNHLVKIPNRTNLSKKINQFSDGFLQREERIPTPEEISEGTGIPFDQLLYLIPAMAKHASLDFKFDEDENKSLVEFIPSSVSTEERVDRLDIKKEEEIFLSWLEPKEREILSLRFAGEFSCELLPISEISQKMGIYPNKVKKIIESSLKKIREKAF